jgi:hypothetical protein
MDSYGNLLSFFTQITYLRRKCFNVTFLLSDYYPVVSTTKSSSASGRQRHFYDEVQLELLDAEFNRDPFPNREGRRRIAQLIGVSEKSIMVWHFDFYFLNQLPKLISFLILSVVVSESPSTCTPT